MRLVEQHVIRATDPRYAAIDRAAFASKNLYNAANYLVRRSFIHEGIALSVAAVFHLIKDHEAYSALPRKVSNDVLRQLDRDWRAFFAALGAWTADRAKFVRRPCLPRYKDKQQGRNLLIYDLQAISVTGLRRGEVIPSQRGISIRTKQTTVTRARIVPRKGYYVVEGRRSRLRARAGASRRKPLTVRWHRQWSQQSRGATCKHSGLRTLDCERAPRQVEQPVLQQAQSAVAAQAR
jgi:putative transposase